MKRLTEENKLVNRYPEIAAEFDIEKNEISVDKISYGSGKKVWWKCQKCGMSWQAAVYNRTLNKQGCPYCTPKNPKPSIANCVATMLPHLLQFWDYEKNGEVTPYNTCYQSHKKVWWICRDNPEHRYLASVQLRAMGYGQCTICKQLKREQREKKRKKKK